MTFEVENPLKIDILLSKLYLECLFCSHETEIPNLTNMSLPSLTPTQIPTTSPGHPNRLYFPSYSIEMLPLAPLMPFEKKGRRLNDTHDHRAGREYGQDNSLHLTITPPMPVLDISIPDLPTSLLSGEVIKMDWKITNKGNCGLKGLFVCLSHASFFSIGSPLNQDSQPIYQESADSNSRESFSHSNVLSDPAVVEVILPSLPENAGIGGSLPPGACTIIPVWIRGDRIGKHVFRFLLGYQSEVRFHKTSLPFLLFFFLECCQKVVASKWGIIIKSGFPLIAVLIF